MDVAVVAEPEITTPAKFVDVDVVTDFIVQLLNILLSALLVSKTPHP